MNMAVKPNNVAGLVMVRKKVVAIVPASVDAPLSFSFASALLLSWESTFAK
ncbi:MAG: hypothetical protein WDM89_17075 [Rhizomicrobium sp.]